MIDQVAGTASRKKIRAGHDDPGDKRDLRRDVGITNWHRAKRMSVKEPIAIRASEKVNRTSERTKQPVDLPGAVSIERREDEVIGMYTAGRARRETLRREPEHQTRDRRARPDTGSAADAASRPVHAFAQCASIRKHRT